MHYGIIKKHDIANGLGVRVSLFVSGCRRHCKGCFQPETWAFDYGQPFTKDTQDEIIAALCPPWIQGLSILGGEPMESENQEVLLPFLKCVRDELPNKDIWLYSGYSYEEIQASELLRHVDILVDGAFIEELREPSLAFMGSRNQRIINVKSSLKAGHAVLSSNRFINH